VVTAGYIAIGGVSDATATAAESWSAVGGVLLIERLDRINADFEIGEALVGSWENPDRERRLVPDDAVIGSYPPTDGPRP